MAKQSKQRQQLGKGLKSLLGNIESDMSMNEEVVKQLSHTVAMIPLKDIEVNPFQPRVDFDEQALEELSDSIKTYGLIQPITVRRPKDGGRFQLISGERRSIASKRAGLKEIPAYIRLVDDQEMMEMALVENIQRENLNPIEIAVTYERLIDEFNLTHNKLADRVGKKRATVTNYLGLLNLPASVKNGLKLQLISTGHAKAIKGIESTFVQEGLYKRIVKEKLSVRELEYLVKEVKAIEDKALIDILHQKVDDENMPTKDLMALIQSLQKIKQPYLAYQILERIFDTEDKFSIQDLADITHFLDSIEDEKLKELLFEEIQEGGSSVLHLAAFAEKYLTQKEKSANKKEQNPLKKSTSLSTEYASEEQFLKEHFGRPIKLNIKENGTGLLSIPFTNVADFNNLLDKIKGEE